MRTGTASGLRSIGGPVVVLAGLISTSFAPARALEFCAPGKDRSYTLAGGEVHHGDIYTAGQTIDISGVQHGDIIGWAQTVSVTGQIDGDLMVGGQSVNIQGKIDDSVRVFANSIVINGLVNGDVLVFGQTLTIGPDAVITGDVVGFVQILSAEGSIEGDLRGGGQTFTVAGSVRGVDATVGEFRLRGSVSGDLRVTCDKLTVDPDARVQGDLAYSSRQPLDELASMGVVAGEIRFEEKVVEREDDGGDGFSLGSMLWQLGWLACSFLVGSILIAIFRKPSSSIEDAVRRETLPSLGVGFLLGLVVPVSALILCIFVVTIPLSMIALALSFIGWYIGKLPVAVWIGRRSLAALGWADPSPYFGLLVGLVPLYILFEIPFLIGFLVYWITMFLGLGAIFLGVRAHLRPRSDSAPPRAGSPEPVASGA